MGDVTGTQAAGNVLVVCAPSGASCLLVAMLRQGRWKVESAESCQAALDHLLSGVGAAPVVICESSLPDGDWKDVLAGMRRGESAPRLIVTSGTVDSALWAEVLNLGGFDVLAQPFDETEVAHVMAAAGRKGDGGGPPSLM